MWEDKPGAEGDHAGDDSSFHRLCGGRGSAVFLLPRSPAGKPERREIGLAAQEKDRAQVRPMAGTELRWSSQTWSRGCHRGGGPGRGWPGWVWSEGTDGDLRSPVVG